MTAPFFVRTRLQKRFNVDNFRNPKLAMDSGRTASGSSENKSDEDAKGEEDCGPDAIELKEEDTFESSSSSSSLDIEGGILNDGGDAEIAAFGTGGGEARTVAPIIIPGGSVLGRPSISLLHESPGGSPLGGGNGGNGGGVRRRLRVVPAKVE